MESLGVIASQSCCTFVSCTSIMWIFCSTAVPKDALLHWELVTVGYLSADNSLLCSRNTKRWTDVAFKWCSVLHTITSLKVVSEFGLQLFTGGFRVNFYLWSSEVCSHGHNMICCAIPCGLFLFVCALVFDAFMSKDRFYGWDRFVCLLIASGKLIKNAPSLKIVINDTPKTLTE